MKRLNHPNVIRLLDIIENEKAIYLVMEWCEEELFDYIVSNERLNELEACKIFGQILAAVEYIHSLNIAHRDLKPENILFDQNGIIKIVDFGLSNTFSSNSTLSTACGSPGYASPDMLKGQPYNGVRVDVWSLGVVLYAMIVGYLPFDG